MAQHTAFVSLIAVNFRKHFFLCFRQPERQHFRNFPAQQPVAGNFASALLFDLLANKSQSQLVGQKFVISQS